MSHQPQMRASDGDREKVAARLCQAYVEGRLPQDEFHTRLHAAYQAVTYGELELVMRDLPVSVTAEAAKDAPGHGSRETGQRPAGSTVMLVLWSVLAYLIVLAVVANLTGEMLSSTFWEALTQFWPGYILLALAIVLGGVSVARWVVRLDRRRRRPGSGS